MKLLFVLTLLTSNIDIALWLARSCTGEANIRSNETGECAAIGHIYRKRAKLSGRTFYWTMRQYSFAVKRDHGKRWIFNLSRKGHAPRGRKIAWSSMLWFADQFVAGRITDPLPKALHFGGWMDRNNLNKRLWRRMQVPKNFKNRFYRRKR